MNTLKDLLHSCSHLLITAGAGMSADSGLPTFRDKEGFWREYPAFKEFNISFEEIATPSTFLTLPELAWSFYAHRFNLYHITQSHTKAMVCFWILQKVKKLFCHNIQCRWAFSQSRFS